jgi:predicted Zn-ribbon and HTH transcriptional regulator
MTLAGFWERYWREDQARRAERLARSPALPTCEDCGVRTVRLHDSRRAPRFCPACIEERMREQRHQAYERRKTRQQAAA